MEKTNILVVEDDNIIAFELQSRLEDQGYNVVGPYAYGEDVIENIGSLNVDLILMDINLKGKLDGIETAQIIRNKHKKPVIYLTAYADNKTLERAKITEPFGYIIKPFEERELFTNIEMALYKHKIELKLNESEQWLHTTLKSIGDGVIATDIDSNIKFMNKVSENLTGWNLTDALGRRIDEVFNIVNEFSRESTINPIESVLKNGIVVGLANHTLLINKNGREIPIADTASPIKDEDGNVTGGVLVFQDQTEMRKYQTALEESEVKYRTTLESIDDGIFVVDKNLNVTLMNNTIINWVKELGSSDFQNYQGMKVHDLKPFANESIINEILSTFETCQPSIKEEDFSFNGTKFLTETKRIPIIIKNNDPKLVTIIRNNTERKLAETDIKQKNIELAKLNASKDKFFSIIAHDLKGPFGAILGLSKIIAEEFQSISTQEMKELSKDMQNSANILYKLLENLLVWSQAQSGRLVINPEKCQLAFLAKQNFDIHTETSKLKQIDFVNNISEDSVVMADIHILNTILRNLISNALKFTSRGGRIEIGTANIKSSDDCQSSDDYVAIYVKDSGIGMNKDILDKLFKIEHKVSRPGTEDEPSTGLGLLLCKDFVEKHGGKIWVESEIDKGSTFYFTLPKAN
jgi:PAS domain S-box-containing protein